MAEQERKTFSIFDFDAALARQLKAAKAEEDVTMAELIEPVLRAFLVKRERLNVRRQTQSA